MDPTPFLMSLAEETWQVAIKTGGYILVLLTLVGNYIKKPGSGKELLEAVSYSVSDLLISVQKRIVYTLLGGGLITLFVPGREYLAIIFITGLLLHMVSKILQRGEVKARERNWSRHLLYSSVLIISLISIISSHQFIKTLPVLYIFAVIFIRL